MTETEITPYVFRVYFQCCDKQTNYEMIFVSSPYVWASMDSAQLYAVMNKYPDDRPYTGKFDVRKEIA